MCKPSGSVPLQLVVMLLLISFWNVRVSRRTGSGEPVECDVSVKTLNDLKTNFAHAHSRTHCE
jgi:hypothetical protein